MVAATLPIASFSGVPLFTGIPLPSTVGPLAAGPLSAEAIALAPLAAANTLLVQLDAYSRGIAPSGAAAVTNPLFPLPFPFNGI